jgi:hypothetical protein
MPPGIEGKSMTESCVVCVYGSLHEAQAAIHILHRANFPRGQILLVGSQPGRRRDAIAGLSLEDDSVRDAAFGAGVGGVLGALAGVSWAALSEAAILLVGGPVVGGLAGALFGALLGSLSGWGVHTSRIAHYEKLLASGRTLVIVEGDPLQVAHADRILQETGPTELHVFARDGSEELQALAT